MKPKWPNFLVLGAPKCGTRSLYTYLRQHPDIFLSEVKEPHFFAYHDERLTLPINDIDSLEYQACQAFYEHILQNQGRLSDVETYTALFNEARDEKAIGEMSTTSLFHPPAPRNIKRYIPEAKMIAILRNPAERVFSAYMDAVRRGHEHRNLSDAIEQEPVDSDYIWWGAGAFSYVRPSLYSKQLQRYFDHFDRSQIKIYLFEEFNTDPMAVIKDIYRFLEVDDAFTPDISRKENVSGVPVNGRFDTFVDFAHTIYTRSQRMKPIKQFKDFIWQGVPEKWRRDVSTARRNTRVVKHFEKDRSEDRSKWEAYHGGQYVKPQIPPDIHRRLIDLCRNDVLVLQDMLGRDLSAWLSVKA